MAVNHPFVLGLHPDCFMKRAFQPTTLTMVRPSFQAWLVDAVLGTEARQRERAGMTLLSLLCFVVFAAVQQLEVSLGLLEARASNLLTCYNLAGASTFFVLIRSGLNLRLRWLGGPTLMLPQGVFAVTSVAWSYAITGPARGAVMGIMMVIVLFGVFSLQERQARCLSVLAYGLLVGVMLWKSLLADDRYDPGLELVHGLFAAGVMLAVSVLVLRLGRLRRRLSDQKAELEQALVKIRALATRDGLTDLLNRRAMSELLLTEARRATRRSDAPECMTLVLMDLDHFKLVNDRFGHRFGDDVLKTFAEVARLALRTTDVVSRWGGEEFLVLMPGTALAEAQAAVDRLRAALKARVLPGAPEAFRVQFSAGLSVCQGEADIEHAIDRADQALYQAKRQGRDRSVCAAPLPGAGGCGRP
jgi:diguanylate cyclase (GGDEF)-like protein